MAFTLDTYAHVLPGMQAEATEELAERVFGVDEGDQPDNGVDLDDEDDEAEPLPNG